MNNTKDHEHSTVQEFYRRMAREAEINSDYTIDTHNESLDECSHRDYIFELLKIENLVNLIISSDLPGFSLKKSGMETRS